MLRIGRTAAVAGGAAGVVLAIALDTVIGAVTVFYSLLVVTLLVPVLGGLYLKTGGGRDALAAIGAGVVTLFAARWVVTPQVPWVDPALAGILAAAAAYAMSMALGRSTRSRHNGQL